MLGMREHAGCCLHLACRHHPARSPHAKDGPRPNVVDGWQNSDKWAGQHCSVHANMPPATTQHHTFCRIAPAYKQASILNCEWAWYQGGQRGRWQCAYTLACVGWCSAHSCPWETITLTGFRRLLQALQYGAPAQRWSTGPTATTPPRCAHHGTQHTSAAKMLFCTPLLWTPCCCKHVLARPPGKST